MVIDSHLHVLKAENFDEVTEAQIGHRHPGDDMQRWIELIRHGINEVAGRSGWPKFNAMIAGAPR
jgi:hypothetical protein